MYEAGGRMDPGPVEDEEVAHPDALFDPLTIEAAIAAANVSNEPASKNTSGPLKPQGMAG